MLPGTEAGRSSHPPIRRHPAPPPDGQRQDVSRRQDVPCTAGQGMRHRQEASRHIRSTSPASAGKGTGTPSFCRPSGDPPEEKVFSLPGRGTYGFLLCSGFCGHEHPGGNPSGSTWCSLPVLMVFIKKGRFFVIVVGALDRQVHTTSWWGDHVRFHPHFLYVTERTMNRVFPVTYKEEEAKVAF